MIRWDRTDKHTLTHSNFIYLIMNLVLFVVMGKQQGNMKPNMTRENFTLNNEKNDNFNSFIYHWFSHKKTPNWRNNRQTHSYKFLQYWCLVYIVSFSSGVNGNAGINQNDITDIKKQRLQTDSALENISEWRQFSGEDMFRSKEPSLWKPFLVLKKFIVLLLTPIFWYSILTEPLSWDSRSELMIFVNSRIWETSQTKPKVRNFLLKHWNSTPIQQGYAVIFLKRMYLLYLVNHWGG